MDQNESLLALMSAVARDPKATSQPGWQKIVLVGEVDAQSAGVGGYSYDVDGRAQPVAATAPVVDLMEQLRDDMATASPTGRAWKACLLRLGSDGQVGADFEYDDDDRWAITPANVATRIAEFRDLPV
ncbi:hypothetical protein [Microbacterium sp.]|uniref:hypothetical protein n=1 Tax=Microbacterium sp. TaxID=51671 RepID=UPI003A8C510C